MRVVHRSLTELQTVPENPAAVVVWHCPMAALPAPILTEAEAARAARYKSASACEQFTASRTALRLILGRTLGLDPYRVPLALEPDGKPFVVGRPVEFNVTHTTGLTLVAVAWVPVGIDVEQIREVENAAGLVGRYFTPAEQREFAELPAPLKAAAFLRGWTCKEAVLKGVGCGVRGLERCTVKLDPRLPPAVVADAELAGGWQLSTWHPTPQTVAALAVRI